MVLGTWLTDPLPFLVLTAAACSAVFVFRPVTRAEIFETAVTLAAAFVLVVGLVWLAKVTIALPRPVEVLGAGSVHGIVPPADPFSFPSGHAARANVVVASLWPTLSGRLRIAATLLVVWVGLSRINLGVHFPADVVAGVVVGVVVPLLLRRAVSSLVKRAVARRKESMTGSP